MARITRNAVSSCADHAAQLRRRLARSLGAGLKRAQDMSRTFVNWRRNFDRRPTKGGADMLIGFRGAPLREQEGQIRCRLQFKHRGGLTLRPLDRRQQTFLRFGMTVVRPRRKDRPFRPQ